MIQDCKQIHVKCMNEDDFLVANTELIGSIAEAQAIFDAYVADGYQAFDLGWSFWKNRLDPAIQLSVGKHIAIWKENLPYGVTEITNLGVAGCDIVILGVKLDGSDNVTDINLEQSFNINCASSTLPIKWHGIKAYIYKGEFQNGVLNTFSRMSLYKAEIYNRMALQYEMSASINSKVINRKEMILNIPGSYLVTEVTNDRSNPGEETRLSVSQNTLAMRRVGNYLYIGGSDSTELLKINLETFTIDDALDVGQTVTSIADTGNFLYCATVDGVDVIKIDLIDFTIADTITIKSEFVGIYNLLGFKKCVYVGTASILEIGKIAENDSVSYITSLSSPSDQIITDGLYIYSGSFSVETYPVIEKIDNDTETVVDSIDRYTTLPLNNASSAMFTDGVYIVSFTHHYANTSQICRIKISDGTIDATLGNNLGEIYYPLYYDGNNVIVYNGNSLYLYNIASNSISYIAETNTVLPYLTSFPWSKIPLEYDGQNYYITSGDEIIKINNCRPVSSLNFATLYSPDPDIVKLQNYIYTTCNLKVRYYIPPDANVENTRMFYIVEFVANAAVDRSLKKFSGKRYWINQRDDAMTILMPSGSEKKIINLEMFDNDGSTPYDFRSEFPADENFIIIAENGSDVQFFLWYNEQLKPTIYSNANMTLTYTITGVFQLWRRRQTEIDLVSLHNSPDADMSGSLEFDNVDNEILNG